MTHNLKAGTTVRTLGPGDGEIAGAVGRTDRFMIDGADTGGRFSVVEHTLAPHVLAGPLHRHTREDEYSYILEGELAALPALAARYGCDLDFEGTELIMGRHELTF